MCLEKIAKDREEEKERDIRSKKTDKMRKSEEQGRTEKNRVEQRRYGQEQKE
jgi:hypothetical protein